MKLKNLRLLFFVLFGLTANIGFADGTLDHDAIKSDIDYKDSTYVKFTLRNNSMKSIPLVIPRVMNPNLSPQSNSGVTLKLGQKIFFKKGRKKYVLLVVDETLKEGMVLDVAKLIKERKKELGL